MPEPIHRLNAALSDRYTIERELGAGGMATVYLAHDVKHDRKVAIKVLKPELAAVLGAERFVQEIKTTANLQHPHILPLFDSGEADGFLYYVMPYIEGDTLRDKLNRETQLGIDEAIKITTDVADALDYAHRNNVIHRDIKPENILLHDGRPMVADFGIALAVSAAAGGRITETGLSLGTPHYMSPEQATADKDLTNRSDIYSLGAMLYEMLTGDPPHTGSSAQQIIMKIVTDTPRPVTELRKSVPLHVAEAVAQALEKLPADRFASAADFAATLGGHRPARTAGATPAARTDARATEWWRRVAMIAAGAAVVLAGLLVWSLAAGPGRARGTEPVEFAYRAGVGGRDRPEVAISPDGRRILQPVADSSGVVRIVMRELGSTALIPIPGTEEGRGAAFSPDGKWVAFTVQLALRKVPIGGGPSTLLADTVTGSAPSWGDDGMIVYSKAGGGLWWVSESGGTPERLTSLDQERREWAHWSAQLLPGGRAILYTSYTTPFDRSRIEAVELGSGRQVVLVEGAVAGQYVTSGHLLFMRDGAIFAVPLDPDRLRVLGSAVPVVQGVAWSPTNGLGGYDVSPNGTLVYVKASEWSVDRRLVWVDRDGNEQPALADAGLWAEPRLSPDGRWIAVTRLDPTPQIWLHDQSRRVMSQLTRSDNTSFNALWMPDSRTVVYTTETPVYDLHRQRIDGGGADTVVASRFDKFASSVSQDGQMVAYFEMWGGAQLKTVPIAGGEPATIGSAEVRQRSPAFAPNGRWLAYEEADPSGQFDVYVREVEGSGRRRQVSANGGSQPRWTRGGREIVYRVGDAIVAASFDPASGAVGRPAVLFRKPDAGRLGNTVGYDVTPDGSRFLLVTPIDRPGAQPNVVVLNWLETLKRMVPR